MIDIWQDNSRAELAATESRLSVLCMLLEANHVALQRALLAIRAPHTLVGRALIAQVFVGRIGRFFESIEHVSDFRRWLGGLVYGHLLQFEQVEVSTRYVVFWVERRSTLDHFDMLSFNREPTLPQCLQHLISQAGRQVLLVASGTPRHNTTSHYLLLQMSTHSEEV